MRTPRSTPTSESAVDDGALSVRLADRTGDSARTLGGTTLRRSALRIGAASALVVALTSAGALLVPAQADDDCPPWLNGGEEAQVGLHLGSFRYGFGGSVCADGPGGRSAEAAGAAIYYEEGADFVGGVSFGGAELGDGSETTTVGGIECLASTSDPALSSTSASASAPTVACDGPGGRSVQAAGPAISHGYITRDGGFCTPEDVVFQGAGVRGLNLCLPWVLLYSAGADVRDGSEGTSVGEAECGGSLPDVACRP